MKKKIIFIFSIILALIIGGIVGFIIGKNKEYKRLTSEDGIYEILGSKNDIEMKKIVGKWRALDSLTKEEAEEKKKNNVYFSNNPYILEIDKNYNFVIEQYKNEPIGNGYYYEYYNGVYSNDQFIIKSKTSKYEKVEKRDIVTFNLIDDDTLIMYYDTFKVKFVRY